MACCWSWAPAWPKTFNIPATLEGLPRNQLLTIAAVALAGGLACVVLATLVLVLISKIVETAMTGDPFVDQNANRLTRVGWLLLGIYSASAWITGVAAVALMPPKLIEMAGKEGGHIQFDAGFDPSPIGNSTVLPDLRPGADLPPRRRNAGRTGRHGLTRCRSPSSWTICFTSAHDPDRVGGEGGYHPRQSFILKTGQGQGDPLLHPGRHLRGGCNRQPGDLLAAEAGESED